MGMRKYSITGSDTNTAATTQLGFTATAAVRPELYDLLISSVTTPADNAGEYFIQRYTAAGTSTGFTPVALDSGDPASTSTAGINHSVEPTYTASAVPLRVAVNQRNTLRWVARDGSEIRTPATAANGLGLLANAIGGAAVAQSYTILFAE
jgi:hypothetical protein